ncbi:MAG: winged helix-turn-helix transcriptional regulator [Tissierellia bacterium]|nr:winged helix-turn-helix transcriptional regulator [Tissierellia bacterium]
MDMLLVLKALSDKNRFKILNLLLRHDYCVRALSKKLGISEAAVSQHLKVLRKAGLLVGEKKGYYMHYRVNGQVLLKLAAMLEELARIERQV